MMYLILLFYLTTIILRVNATCDAPSPAFLLPTFDVHDPALRSVSRGIVSYLREAITSNHKYDTTSFSLSVTSQQETLFEYHHTARNRSTFFDGGANPVSYDTRYRIASMTKPFVVLAILQLQKAGHLSLDDPVLKYLPDLEDGQTGSLPWHDITLRALMSQQSGIPRDFAQGDLLNDPELKDLLGLPDVDTKDLELPTCDEMVNYTRPCNVTDFTNWIKTLPPLFAPNQHPSYSNINFNLLGLVISVVSNTSFESYIHHHILDPLNMTQTSFTQPPNKHAAMSPTGGAEIYWPFDMGVQNAAGGLYSSSQDMSVWLRYVLSTYNGQTPAVNWFAPSSFSGSIQTFYGVPWEIYRGKVGELLHGVGSGKGSTRPLAFVTKGGGLPGYTSLVMMLPDYALGITILVVGDGDAYPIIRDVVAREMVRYAEGLALKNLQEKYVGVYADADTNSTIVLERSEEDGLYVSGWTSHGVDTIQGLSPRFVARETDTMILRVVPTLLYVNETAQRGERWMMLPGVIKGKGTDGDGSRASGASDFFGNYCTSDWEVGMYAGVTLNEVVFWSDEDDKKGKGERVVEVGLPGFRRVLKRVVKDDDDDGCGKDREEDEILRVQG